LDPNDITAIDYLGWSALRKGKPDEAEARFGARWMFRPKGPEALKEMAHSLGRQKKPEASGVYARLSRTHAK